MNNSEIRTLLKQELLARIALIEDERVPLELLERDLWRGYYSLHRRFDDLGAQLERMEGRTREQSDRRPCAFNRDSAGAVMHMVTGINGQLEQDRSYVKKTLRSAREVTIIDPYFFSWNGANKAYGTKTDYLNFITSLVPESATGVEIVHLPGPEANLRHRFGKVMSSRHVKVRTIGSTEFHDRFLIKDDDSGLLLGTSIGGLGNKISIALPLPDDDFREIMKVLRGLRDSK